MKYIATIDERSFEIEINEEDEVIVDDLATPIDFQAIAEPAVYSLIINGQSYEAHVSPTDGGWQVLVRGQLYLVDVEDERQRRLRQASTSRIVQAGEFQLKAPMPGLIVAVPVQVGDEVDKGGNLIVLESMKMQNELKAPRSGKVSRVQVRAGDSVEQNQILVTLD